MFLIKLASKRAFTFFQLGNTLYIIIIFYMSLGLQRHEKMYIKNRQKSFYYLYAAFRIKRNHNIKHLTWHFGYCSSGVRATFQPSSGGMQIRADSNQTAPIMMIALTGVRFFRYSTACVMLQYRSNEIRHKFIMEAVLSKTSIAEWTSHLKQNQYDRYPFHNFNY